MGEMSRDLYVQTIETQKRETEFFSTTASNFCVEALYLFYLVIYSKQACLVYLTAEPIPFS